MRREESYTRLFIGNLSRSVRDVDLDYEFGRFGRVKDVYMKRGYGFVEFYYPKDAAAAVRCMDDRLFFGNHIVVEYSRMDRKSLHPGRRSPLSRQCIDGSRSPIYKTGRRGGELSLKPYHRRGRERSQELYLRTERERARNNDICYNCGLGGHMAKDCKAANWKNRCYDCGQFGHIRSQCPEKRNKRRERSRSSSRSSSPNDRRKCPTLKDAQKSSSLSRSCSDGAVSENKKGREDGANSEENPNADCPSPQVDLNGEV